MKRGTKGVYWIARADLAQAQAELEAWARVASKAGLREKIDFGQAFDILARIDAARLALEKGGKP